jgi:sugar (pentulose or hexulose) kinase
MEITREAIQKHRVELQAVLERLNGQIAMHSQEMASASRDADRVAGGIASCDYWMGLLDGTGVPPALPGQAEVGATEEAVAPPNARDENIEEK